MGTPETACRVRNSTFVYIPPIFPSLQIPAIFPYRVGYVFCISRHHLFPGKLLVLRAPGLMGRAHWRSPSIAATLFGGLLECLRGSS